MSSPLPAPPSIGGVWLNSLEGRRACRFSAGVSSAATPCWPAADSLAGLAITASTVEAVISTDTPAATALVADLWTAIRAAVGDMRRLVYDRRPPSPDGTAKP